MNAHLFIDMYGAEAAERIVENRVFDAEYYSEKTGSYYSSYKKDALEIRKLILAISEYKQLAMAKAAYETRLKHWNASLNKAISDREELGAKS
ncbi:hypothetical protein AYL20_01380 [Acinetobacter venetianus]|uniref:hypothetical protein n=1 Tax=Acinetobacter venetianus TaxID=52133 RepID=UPI00077583FA|nr:hypothetical protein [Acinetobacter venetianus]KXO82676.1 hypothetical protein AYL20_01380 [Acinetobacter venetianus]